LWVKLLLIAAVGALVPAIFEAGFWLARGFNVGVAIDCAVELFATRLIVIAPFVGVACCSPTFGDYVMALLRLFGLILLVTFILGVLLIPLAAVITIISGVHLWSTLDRVSELSDALTYGLSWAGVLWLGRSQLPRLGATTVAAVCATPISALLLLSLVSGTVTPLPTEAKQQEIPQELSLHGEENTLIAAKQQSGIDSVYTDVRFSSPVSPRFAPDTVRCLSTDTVRAAVEREGVRVRAIGWLPNCFAFGKS
jgi:hypothetical protein